MIMKLILFTSLYFSPDISKSYSQKLLTENEFNVIQRNPTFIIYVYACVCRGTYEWRSEGNLQLSVLSFHHRGPRGRTRASVLAASPFAHWAISIFLKNKILF